MACTEYRGRALVVGGRGLYAFDQIQTEKGDVEGSLKDKIIRVTGRQ